MGSLINSLSGGTLEMPIDVLQRMEHQGVGDNFALAELSRWSMIEPPQIWCAWAVKMRPVWVYEWECTRCARKFTTLELFDPKLYTSLFTACGPGHTCHDGFEAGSTLTGSKLALYEDKTEHHVGATFGGIYRHDEQSAIHVYPVAREEERQWEEEREEVERIHKSKMWTLWSLMIMVVGIIVVLVSCDLSCDHRLQDTTWFQTRGALQDMLDNGSNINDHNIEYYRLDVSQTEKGSKTNDRSNTGDGESKV